MHLTVEMDKVSFLWPADYRVIFLTVFKNVIVSFGIVQCKYFGRFRIQWPKSCCSWDVSGCWYPSTKENIPQHVRCTTDDYRITQFRKVSEFLIKSWLFDHTLKTWIRLLAFIGHPLDSSWATENSIEGNICAWDGENYEVWSIFRYRSIWSYRTRQR